MTQAALAGPDFSKGFISLLETGRTRVSLRAAHVLAGRLGVDVTDLLSGASGDRQDQEFILLRAEQELRSGNAKGATELASAWTKRSSGITKARFQRLLARAMIETSRSPDAVKLLDDALRAFRAFGAKEFVARTLYDLARAHVRLYAFGEAVRYALEAEQAIARGDVVDRTLELEIHQFLANVHLALGDLASAEIRGERARQIAEDAEDPSAVAKMYQALALTRYEQGDPEAALAYARKSVEQWEQLGQSEKLAETWNTLGWLFIKREHFGKADEALDRADAMAKEHRLERLNPFIAVNRAALALARGSAREAARLANAVATSADAAGEARARAVLLEARALAAAGAPLAQVTKAFDAAIKAHADATPRDKARAHQAYADALSARKQPADAYAEARKALDLVGPKI